MRESARKLIKLFEEKVGPIPAYMAGNEEDYFIPSIKREIFKKAIQEAFPDLRYRKIDGLESIRQFANKLEEEENKRTEFFDKALKIISELTGHPEYTFDSVLYAEFKPKHSSGSKRLSDEANYFIKCQKVYNALAEKMYTTWTFHPSSPALERVTTLHELIDLYYRKGRF